LRTVLGKNEAYKSYFVMCLQLENSVQSSFGGHERVLKITVIISPSHDQEVYPGFLVIRKPWFFKKNKNSGRLCGEKEKKLIHGDRHKTAMCDRRASIAI